MRYSIYPEKPGNMSKSMEGLITLFFLCFSLFSISRSMATTQDTLTPGQPIKDGETLVSADERFELGLFSPANSTTQFLGIWYKKISSRTYVWVANRKSPIMTTSGVFKINDQGILILFNGHNQVIWSSNTSRTAQNPSAQLLDSGNFVVRDSKGNVLWQSFDYPSHTLLAGMKLGRNLAMDLDWSLTAWKSLNDPAPGDFSFWLDPRGFPQLVITNRTAIQFRMGSWNGLHFTGSPQLKQNPIYSFQFVSNKHEIYYMYELKNNSLATMAVLNEAGIIQRYVSVDRTHTWNLFFAVPIDRCDSYALCGAYASCNSGNYPFCACLEGFVPKSPSDWEQADWSHGCVRKTKLDCHNGDGFWKRTGLKLPDTSSAWVNESLSLKECEAICLRNCSCVAYANLDVRGGGSGCLLWFHNLIDMREFIEGGQDLYIRMAASELARLKARKKSNENRKDGIIVGCLIFIMGMLMLALFFYMRKRKHKQHGMMNDDEMRDYDKDSVMEEMELPIFDLAIIKDATNNFSRNNKLGEGGFGPVFKGILSDGKEIAVKRLSKSSGQGSTEFKNEVILISKLQHRNLVKLLGCCIQKDEKMLIYEFMPNKSLDFFIFDQMRSNFLDWDKRYHIIGGIARGLLYLHQDSRLRIIHRDLKASNVLLDKDMNPKISDFGLARIFGGDQTEANTNKVAGTYGYMSPEYAVDGLFSMKSDVFSFGVLVLEIVSGKKNRGFSHPNHNHNLLGHAWKLWIAEKSMELVDNMLDSFVVLEVVRCIQVGLLCVQQRPEDRPNMSSVVVMLGSESILPQPKQPGFFTERNMPKAEGLISKNGSSSINEMSTTIIEPR